MNRPKTPKQKKLSMGAAIPIGIAIGTALGVALDNIPAGVSGGIVIGAVNNRSE